MRTLLSALAFLLTATLAQAACNGPDAFLALPEDTQKTLRAEAAKAPFHQGIFWQVEKNGITSTLVGTYHMSHPTHARTVAALAALPTEHAQLLLELNAEAQLAFQRHLTETPSAYLIEEGDSLIDRLGDTHWPAVAASLKERGMPPFMAARYQPWFLGLTIAVPPCAMADVIAGKPGLDAMIEEHATAQQLPTGSLDTTEGLLAILAADPLDKQTEDLRRSIDMGLLDDGDALMPAMNTLYAQEEIQLIWDLGRHMAMTRAASAGEADDFGAIFDEIEAGLLERRNRQWADRLIPELAQTSSIVAVGAMHLPGETGLLRLLEAAGYSVTRLSRD